MYILTLSRLVAAKITVRDQAHGLARLDCHNADQRL
jgi:hypothetical protein